MRGIILTVMVAGIFAASAQAQYSVPMIQTNIAFTRAMINQIYINKKASSDCLYGRRMYGNDSLCTSSDVKNSSSKSNTGNKVNSANAATTTATHKGIAKFKPSASINVADEIVNGLTDNADARAAWKEAIAIVRQDYEEKAASLGGKNDVASALAYFSHNMLLVYNDKETTDLNALYKGMTEVLENSDDLVKKSDADKQKFSDALIVYTTIPLIAYLDAKQTGSAEKLASAKAAAKQVFETVTKSKIE